MRRGAVQRGPGEQGPRTHAHTAHGTFPAPAAAQTPRPTQLSFAMAAQTPRPTQLSFAMAFGSPAGSRSASFEDLLDLGTAAASESSTSMTPCPRAHQCARDGPTPPTPLLADAHRAAPGYAPTRFVPICCVDPPRHHTCAIDCPAEAARPDSAAGGMEDDPDQQGQYTRRCCPACHRTRAAAARESASSGPPRFARRLMVARHEALVQAHQALAVNQTAPTGVHRPAA